MSLSYFCKFNTFKSKLAIFITYVPLLPLKFESNLIFLLWLILFAKRLLVL